MIAIHPQYIADTAGQNLVILPQHEFDALLEELDELKDILLYDEVKKSDNGERIPIAEAFKITDSK